MGFLMLPTQSRRREGMEHIKAQGSSDSKHFSPKRVYRFQRLSQVLIDDLMDVFGQMDGLLPAGIFQVWSKPMGLIPHLKYPFPQ